MPPDQAQRRLLAWLDEHGIEIGPEIGDGRFMYLTTDFSYEYVRINADYRT